MTITRKYPLRRYSYVSIIRPGLIFLLRDLLYFNGYVVKEVTQQKYKTWSYNRDERVRVYRYWDLLVIFSILNFELHSFKSFFIIQWTKRSSYSSSMWSNWIVTKFIWPQFDEKSDFGNASTTWCGKSLSSFITFLLR